MKALLRGVVISTVVAALFGVAVAVESEPKPAAEAAATDDTAHAAKPIGTGMAAMEKAAEHNKYLFALFYKEETSSRPVLPGA